MGSVLPCSAASGSAQVVSVFLTLFWHVQWEKPPLQTLDWEKERKEVFEIEAKAQGLFHMWDPDLRGGSQELL